MEISFCSTEISSMVLLKMKEPAESYLRHHQLHRHCPCLPQRLDGCSSSYLASSFLFTGATRGWQGDTSTPVVVAQARYILTCNCRSILMYPEPVITGSTCLPGLSLTVGIISDKNLSLPPITMAASLTLFGMRSYLHQISYSNFNHSAVFDQITIILHLYTIIEMRLIR